MWAAHAAALTALPSGLWRIIVACGGPSGYTPAGLLEICPPGFAGPAYLLILSVLTELAAVATLGLVRPWGERVPRWVPVLGGRSLPYLTVVAIAGAGAAVLAALWTPMLFWWMLPHSGMTEMAGCWSGCSISRWWPGRRCSPWSRSTTGAAGGTDDGDAGPPQARAAEPRPEPPAYGLSRWPTA
ncbi:hypothetical protein Asera_11870 [Actinocatenispora sera]|uniref:Uncharacterized protein n=1 Tax=Actinocatenispora sera TaxID=390989 RepID=A0A810KXI7_9ACTN|nr:hypothetical protein Asera_11870 [Actinocatenispora sera]